MSTVNQQPEMVANQQPKQLPDFKVDLAGGMGVTAWGNSIQTAKGPKKVYSVTISPRRYQNSAGEWCDSKFFNPADLPALIFGLEEMLRWCFRQRERQPGEDETEFSS